MIFVFIELYNLGINERYDRKFHYLFLNILLLGIIIVTINTVMTKRMVIICQKKVLTIKSTVGTTICLTELRQHNII